MLAQSLKKQNQQLKTQNTILTDSIQKLNTSLDSVAQLKTKLTADYEKLKAQYGKSGTKADSLFKVCQLQASEIYALQVTNDSLSSRIQKLLAERSALQYQTDSLLALQERKLEEKKQKELWDRRAWFNVAYSPQKINSDLYRPELKADYAVGITWGRSYYLHKKPLANMVRFALNWSFFDLNIAQYSAPYSSRVDEGDDDLSSGGLASASYYPSARTDDFTGSEGDDYWNDPKKLQIQVDFMENNPNYVVCYHSCEVIDSYGNAIKSSDIKYRDSSGYDMQRLKVGLPTRCVVYRNVIDFFEPNLSSYSRKILNADTFLWTLLGEYGDAKYLKEIKPAVYRIHKGGVWSMVDEKERFIIHSKSFFNMSEYFAIKGNAELASFFLSLSMSNLIYASSLEKIRYIDTRIMKDQEEKDKESRKKRNKKYDEMVRGMYNEDPRRCLRWFITNDPTPECMIDPKEFENTYGETWKRIETLDTDFVDEFKLEKILTEEDNETLKDTILSEEFILQAIKSRSNLSAHGTSICCCKKQGRDKNLRHHNASAFDGQQNRTPCRVPAKSASNCLSTPVRALIRADQDIHSAPKTPRHKGLL